MIEVWWVGAQLHTLTEQSCLVSQVGYCHIQDNRTSSCTTLATIVFVKVHITEGIVYQIHHIHLHRQTFWF